MAITPAGLSPASVSQPTPSRLQTPAPRPESPPSSPPDRVSLSAPEAPASPEGGAVVAGLGSAFGPQPQAQTPPRDQLRGLADREQAIRRELFSRPPSGATPEQIQQLRAHREGLQRELTGIQTQRQGLFDQVRQQEGGRPQAPSLAGTAAEVGLGMVPIVGNAMSAYDAYRELRQGNYGMAALAGVGVVPGVGNAVRGVTGAGRLARAASAGGRQTEEVVRSHATYERAMNAAMRETGPLGHAAVPNIARVGPNAGQVNGMTLGQRGWRLDFDPSKGAHVNWFDFSRGGRSSGMGRWGAETFPGGEAAYQQLLRQFQR